MSDLPRMRVQRQDEEVWHAFEFDDLLPVTACGITIPHDPGSGSRYATVEVDPQPVCNDCKENA